MGRAVLLGLALAAMLGALLLFAGHGESEPWHHNVQCFRCLERQIRGLRHQQLPVRMRRLEDRLEQQDQFIVWLEERAVRQEARTADLASKLSDFQKCFEQLPLTRYGEETGPSGYVFQLEGPEGPDTFPTTALDLSYPHDPVGAWAWVNPCNPDRVTPKSALLPTP